MSRPDVLVLGGGPGGATLAALAAKAGASVVLVERDRFPREKVCGEFVSAEGCAVLGRLGLLPELERRGAAWMDSCRLSDRRGRLLDRPLPDLPGLGRQALGVSRSVLDATLLALAASAGADVRERCEGAAPLLDGGWVAGARVRSAGSRSDGEALRASVVVAADGRRSTMQRALRPWIGDPLMTRPRSWFGLEAHFEGNAGRLGRRIELHLFNGGYVGLGSVETGRVNLCLLTRVRALRRCGGSPDRLLEERVKANPAARASLEGLARAGDWKSVGPLRFGVRDASLSGAFLVGDAAGTVDPFCGEGISHALRGAEIALPFVLEAVARGRVTPDLAEGYRRTWLAEFAAVTRRARWLGTLLGSAPLAGGARALLAGPCRGLLPRLVLATRTGSPGRPRAVFARRGAGG